MKKDYYEQQKSNNTRPQNRRPHQRNPRHRKTPSKSTLLLKSTVIALFIVFVVLAAALFVVKAKTGRNFIAELGNKPCSDSAASEVIISSEVEEISANHRVITILTEKDKSGNQEIIRINAKCGGEINRILLKTAANAAKDKKKLEEKND